jgi:hypothetical protein
MTKDRLMQNGNWYVRRASRPPPAHIKRASRRIHFQEPAIYGQAQLPSAEMLQHRQSTRSSKNMYPLRLPSCLEYDLYPYKKFTERP